jgi:hypothetical protein
MSEKILFAIVISILVLTLIIGCSYPVSKNAPEKKIPSCPVCDHPTNETNNTNTVNTSKFLVHVYVEDESNIEGNVNITIRIDNRIITVWDHQISVPMVTPNLGPPKEITLGNGTHSICAFEKYQNIMNSTGFNVTQEKYLAVIYYHSENTNYPSPPKLDFWISDTPIGFD